MHLIWFGKKNWTYCKYFCELQMKMKPKKLFQPNETHQNSSTLYTNIMICGHKICGFFKMFNAIRKKKKNVRNTSSFREHLLVFLCAVTSFYFSCL